MAEYIEREAAIKELLTDAPEQVGYSRDDAADCIRYMGAADIVLRVHGRWISDESDVLFHCSLCETQISTSWDYDDLHWNYCPNCGAKMVERKEK